jgi:hypothetical protein
MTKRSEEMTDGAETSGPAALHILHAEQQFIQVSSMKRTGENERINQLCRQAPHQAYRPRKVIIIGAGMQTAVKLQNDGGMLNAASGDVSFPL